MATEGIFSRNLCLGPLATRWAHYATKLAIPSPPLTMNFTELPDDSGFPPEADGPIYWSEPLMS